MTVSACQRKIKNAENRLKKERHHTGADFFTAQTVDSCGDSTERRPLDRISVSDFTFQSVTFKRVRLNCMHYLIVKKKKKKFLRCNYHFYGVITTLPQFCSVYVDET